jgi:flagellar hook protein FlgE
MDSLVGQVDAVIADARRASIPGAIGNSPDRPGAVILSPIAGMRSQTSPSASPLSVAIDGPGMFVLEDGAQQAYGRLGDFTINGEGALVDGRGRPVCGVQMPAPALFTRVAPIHVGDAGRYSSLSIDDNGVLKGIVNGRTVEVARIALAIFPAPERLVRIDENTVRTTESAGTPHLQFPAAPNVGALRAHSLESGLVDLEGDLASLWRLRRRGELEAARAFAADECLREVLGLVK